MIIQYHCPVIVMLTRLVDNYRTSESVSRFIATQGPLSHTSEDFWEMIIQYHCPVIVMLTRLVDNYRTVKCVDYFQAEDGPRDFGNICISTKWIQTADNSLILRCLEVKYKESEEPPLSVLHVQYPEWPDHGVPKDTLAVREIFKRIAGIGRTGTYCAIHNTIQRILIGDTTAVDLVNTIAAFRSQRIGMCRHWNSISSAMMRLLMNLTLTLLTICDPYFAGTISLRCGPSVFCVMVGSKCNLTLIISVIVANRMRASDMINRCTVALDSLNYSKNRYTDVLPFDDNRVILKRCTDYRSSARGYINASFVTTSESVSRFIATQGPLSHTSEDFWEMIIQYHCPVIVMLTRLVDNYRANRMRASDMINRCTVALDSLNYSKNRYTDVLPFDDNRVILKRCTDYRSSARGYINASFVTTSESVSRFIATQGQLSHTSEDFWEMIIQYHCPVIVMLTRLVDNYRTVKCVDYFQAEDGPRDFGNICISTKWIQTADNSLILRCLEVKYKESEEPPLSVLHVQYPEWPDHGVPKDTLAVREIFKRIAGLPPSLGQLLFTAVQVLVELEHIVPSTTLSKEFLLGTRPLWTLLTIAAFRSQRIGMVQTLEQYLFCYDATIDELDPYFADYM
ncbi:UNVERIFIED_CONTAM: Protein-tyrosine-phosphatase PTP1 [Sesamum calycinum]|uniref:Protein-tyrosine-phosphatase PTP1 n=1 Tax=Sesamum calycinum TaxID=2727403 RepID=A0AAW2QNY2_9LAMI